METRTMVGLLGLGVYVVWLILIYIVHWWYLTTQCKYNIDIPYDPKQLEHVQAKSRRATRLTYIANALGLAVFLFWNYTR